MIATDPGDKTGYLDGFRAWRVRVSERTTYLFFELLTDQGSTGTGEASMSGDDAFTTRIATRLFEEQYRGHRVADLAATQEWPRTMDSEAPSLHELAAISALDQCLWDLRGQELRMPVHALLGGPRRDSIPLYANINRGLVDRSPMAFAERAAAAVSSGFALVKCAPFDSVRPSHEPSHPFVRVGLMRIKAVAEALDGRAGLMVDCHGRLSPATSLALLPGLRDVGLSWLEEPVITHAGMNAVIAGADGGPVPSYPPTNVGSTYGRLAEEGVRLAGGELEWEVGRFQELLEAGIDCLMPDVKYCGGLSVAMAVDDLASARGGSVAPHNPSGPIATLASVHACAAMSAFETLEYQWGEVADPERLLTPHVPSTGGTIPVSHLPGLGRSLDHDALRDIQIPIDRGGRV